MPEPKSNGRIISCRRWARAQRFSKGSSDEIADKLIDLMKAKGGLQ